MVSLLYPQFLHIHGFNPLQTMQHRDFTMEKYPHIGVLLQFKPHIVQRSVVSTMRLVLCQTKTYQTTKFRSLWAWTDVCNVAALGDCPTPRRVDPDGGKNTAMDVKVCFGIVCFKCKMDKCNNWTIFKHMALISQTKLPVLRKRIMQLRLQTHIIKQYMC